jgi:hippurate hydrolase
MIGREIDAFAPGLVSVTHIEAGSTHNVIPETAWFEGTIRAVAETTRQRVHESLARVAHSIAAAHDCRADVHIEPGYPVTVNDPGQVARVADLARRTLGPGRFVEMPQPVMGAEDFSYVLQGVPGCMTLLGACPTDIADSFSAPPCHSNRMRLVEAAFRTGAALHLASAIAS